jgi:hypothetical protein
MKYSFAIMALTGEASAWWGRGHLMVNRIAYEALEQENPAVLKAANDILNTLHQTMPDMVTNESQWPFVECATWADDIKGKGGKFQSGWHFIDRPFLDEGGKLTDFSFVIEP